MPISVPYRDTLIEDLKNHKEAVAYLNAAFFEILNNNDEESRKLFQMAVQDVIEAQMGMENLIRKSLVSKDVISKALAPKKDIDFISLSIILTALGIKLEMA